MTSLFQIIKDIIFNKDKILYIICSHNLFKKDKLTLEASQFAIVSISDFVIKIG